MCIIPINLLFSWHKNIIKTKIIIQNIFPRKKESLIINNLVNLREYINLGGSNIIVNNNLINTF